MAFLIAGVSLTDVQCITATGLHGLETTAGLTLDPCSVLGICFQDHWLNRHPLYTQEDSSSNHLVFRSWA